MPVADDIKGNNIQLITVYWVHNYLYDGLQAKLLSDIASEGSAFVLRSVGPYEAAVTRMQHLLCKGN